MLKKNVYINTIFSKISLVIFSFSNSVIINRYLGPELKGEYTYIINITNILVLLFSYSVAQSYPYFSKIYDKEIKHKFINIFYVQLVIFSILSLSMFLVSFNSNKVFLIILISTISQFNIQLNFMAIVENIREKNKMSLLSISIYTLLLILVFLSSSKNLNLVIYAYIFYMIFNSVQIIIKNKYLPKIYYKNKIPLKEVFRFNTFPTIVSLMITFNYSIDILILERYVTFKEIGIYSVGVTLASMLWIIPDAFKDVLFSKSKDKESPMEVFFSIKFNSYLSLMIILIFVFIGKIFIEILYGNDFIDSYAVTLILFLGTIPMAFFKIINTMFIANGKQFFTFKILLISVSVNILSNFILVPLYNIEGAAVSSLISYTICGSLMVMKYKQLHQNILPPKYSTLFWSSEEIKKIKMRLKNE